MIQFDKKISIDGVAVIVVAIGFTVWLATMRAQVTQNTKDIQANQQNDKEWLEKLQATQDTEAQNLAVLTALENQKLKNDP